MKKAHVNGVKVGVGYGQPPNQTRFKPGQSGNPKGRPRGSTSPKSVVQRIMSEKLSVREGDNVRLISKFEAMMRSLTVKALKGDPKALAAVLKLVTEGGHFAEPVPSSLTIRFVNAPERKIDS